MYESLRNNRDRSTGSGDDLNSETQESSQLSYQCYFLLRHMTLQRLTKGTGGILLTLTQYSSGVHSIVLTMVRLIWGWKSRYGL